MVIDAREIGLEAVWYIIGGMVVGVVIASLLLALIATQFGPRRFGPTAFVLSLFVVVAALVIVVVVWRTVDGDVTGWDLIWAAGLAVVGLQCAHRLVRPS